MRFVLVAALVVGCRGSHQGSGQIAEVYVFAGDLAPAGGATVIAHRATGELIDTVQADAVGHAELGTEDGAQITVVFPSDLSAITPELWLVTAPAPAADGELDIHGPPDAPAPPTVAGALTVDPKKNLNGADMFEVELGCTITQVTAFPASIDVSSRCLGSDSNLDVLVLGYASGQVIGYAAGRLDLSSGAATFAPTDWSTPASAIPIMLDGVSPLLDWVLYADGLPFAAQPIAGSAPVWTGLAVDAATVHATIATATNSRITTREIAGAPTAIAFSASDFLPAIDRTLVLDTTSGTQLSWAPADVGADAIDLHLEWDVGLRGPAVPPGSHHVVWDVVLPPDASDATLAQLAGDVGTLAGPPDGTPDATLRYLATTPATGWDALVANGLYVEATAGVSTIAPPTTAELRVTQTTGYAP